MRKRCRNRRKRHSFRSMDTCRRCGFKRLLKSRTLIHVFVPRTFVDDDCIWPAMQKLINVETKKGTKDFRYWMSIRTVFRKDSE